MEIRGVNTDDAGLSFGNGADYWNGSSSDWIKEQDPTLGAVACYYTKGSTQPGHVAVVEQIIDADTIVVSESDWGTVNDQGTYFRTVTCRRQYGWRPDDIWNVAAYGFLRNPYVKAGGKLSKAVLLLMMKRKEEDNEQKKRVTRTV